MVIRFMSMVASSEVAYVLGPNVLPEFSSAAAEALAAINDLERLLCAGVAEMVWAAGSDRGLFDEAGKRPYYLVTTEALHFGVLLKKGGIFSKAASTNRSIPASRVVGLNSDYQSATDLLDESGEQVAFIKFSNVLTRQFNRSRQDPAPANPGHFGEFPPQRQMSNFLAAFGLSL